MTEDFEITGKKKLIVDDDGYFNVRRIETSPNTPDPAVSEKLYHGVYYNAPSAVDKVRIVTGKNWDYRIINNKPTFSSDWGGDHHVNSFANNPVILDAASCGESYLSPDEGTSNLTYDHLGCTDLKITVPAL